MTHDTIAAALHSIAGSDGELPRNTAVEICFGPGMVLIGWPELQENGFYAITTLDAKPKTYLMHASVPLWVRSFVA